jgi:hypothetical protein
MPVESEPFDELIDEELYLVGFSPDGIHLRFAGPAGPELRADLPVVDRGGSQWVPQEDGYRDALIGTVRARLVKGAVTAESIVLRFDDGTTLSISLAQDPSGREVELAELTTWDGNLWVFPAS